MNPMNPINFDLDAFISAQQTSLASGSGIGSHSQSSPLKNPSSGKAPRNWVSRACDRCRKRKARCDEQTPCRNCAEAGAACTHDAPVLKRGPRPKEKNNLENRLRNLESLLASISGGTASASSSLSSSELDLVRTAAQTLSDSNVTPDHALFTDMASMASFKQSAPVNETLMDTTQFALQTASLGPFSAGQPINNLNNTTLPAVPLLQGSRTFVANDELLYRDNDGQTKWLGPSSGMPLLDRLKTCPSVPQVKDEWMSLSTAIGLGQPVSMSPEAFFSPDIDHTFLDSGLWGRVLSICPQDLLDSLVRSYFTISHLLWPILHAPTFLRRYANPSSRSHTSFVALVLSVGSLSSRYTQDPRLSSPAQGKHTGTLRGDLIELAREVTLTTSTEKADIHLVQALFNLSVVQEGTARPGLLWSYLSLAISMAIDMGLHRNQNEYGGFTAVDLEVQKRTLWAVYCQNIKASCTYGRPPLLCLSDISLEEPAAVDDLYISAEKGIGSQPHDVPSVMAGYVISIRLHTILERTIRRINSVEREADKSFFSLVSSSTPGKYLVEDELDLLPRISDGLPGDWSYSPATVTDPDSVRFFERTRCFMLIHFIRLLCSRHKFSKIISGADGMSDPTEEQSVLVQIVQPALAIVGTYSVIDSRGRLDFFGAHAAGAGLIGVLLYVRSGVNISSLDQLAMHGLTTSITVLRRLGAHRPAGTRSAELLAEFARTCRLIDDPPGGSTSRPMTAPHASVDIPMLQALPKRSAAVSIDPSLKEQESDFVEQWYNLMQTDWAVDFNFNQMGGVGGGGS